MAKKRKNNYIFWICRKIKKRIPTLVFLSALTMIVSYAGVQSALATKGIVNSALAGDRSAFVFFASVFLGLALVRFAGNLILQYLRVNVQEQMERDFKSSILQTILQADYHAVSRYHSGDLIQRMNADAGTIYGSVMTLTSNFSYTFMALGGAVAALLQIAPMFTILFGSLALIFASTSLLFRNRIKRLSKDSSAANGVVGGFLHESISKLMVIQALDVSKEMEARTNKVLDDRWIVRAKQRNIHLLASIGTSLVSYGGNLVTLLWGATQILSGRLTAGDLSAMTSLVTTIQSSAVTVPMQLPQLFAVGAACERIMELEALPKQPEPDARNIRALYDSVTGFTAEHLTFAYAQEPVMKDVSLTVPKGGLTVIIGQSGIGKSTLLKLLLGLYKPRSGKLTIDTPDGSVPVNRVTRSMFSYAPQGNFLLSGTIRENLTFTNPDATEEEIRVALHASALDDYVATLPLGLETVLMENGAGLSEGQAQRLSLARAIISGAPVLLLDEVTSALDAATEKTVLERITALPGKTCIAVTHRPAALELADHIIEVTENGMTISHCE